MRIPRFAALLSLLAILPSRPARSAGANGFDLGVIVDGESRPEYRARGTLYVEALRGRTYTLRLSNPLPYRVAVALSVDGLNTVDARHTDAWGARKWVLEPYGSMIVPGWQVGGSTARSFTFTGERHSYGAWLGKTDDLGVIEAVFFREKPPRPIARRELQEQAPLPSGGVPAPSEAPSLDGRSAKRQDSSAESGAASAAPRPALSEEYAATGMGGRVDNPVETVFLDLDRSPVATVRIRYEFRAQLVQLGVLPRWPTPLERREGASGFKDGYCPQPAR